jgi:hypothetical protein
LERSSLGKMIVFFGKGVRADEREQGEQRKKASLDSQEFSGFGAGS